MNYVMSVFQEAGIKVSVRQSETESESSRALIFWGEISNSVFFPAFCCLFFVCFFNPKLLMTFFQMRSDLTDKYIFEVT